MIKKNIHSVTAFAPATCANVAVGFDILGFAFHAVGDSVTLTRRNDNKIVIEKIDSTEKLPSEIERNTASVVIQKVCEDLRVNHGFSLHIHKKIPLSSGMGGSAASAVAALVAFNAFLESPLTAHQLAQYALLGEEVASGHQHADNIVPCIFGGFTLVQSASPIAVIKLPTPDVTCILVHPHLHVPTREARSVLAASISLKDYIKQSANLAAFISCLYSNDKAILKTSLTDILIEPQRAQFVPGFYAIKQAALEAGALGVSFSGSGPSIFAFADNEAEAANIANAMCDQLKLLNMNYDYWISSISDQAAHVTEIKQS